MTALTLLVEGQRFEGWKRVAVTRGIEQLAGTFDITCADRWALQRQALPVSKGQACEVQIGGKPVIKGFINSAAPNYSGRGHELQVRGRDATQDLVDSSATTDGGGWVGRSLMQIATALCKPFGIKVVLSADAGVQAAAKQAFQYQHLNVGETVNEALSRLARIRGVLLTSNVAGDLIITRAGTARAQTVLRLGHNILEASAEDSDLDRFHEYRVIAQTRESDANAGAVAQQVGAPVFDKGMRKGRLLIVDPLDSADHAGCKALAAWTRDVRAARGAGVTYTVRGWLDGDQPWQPNTLVTVDDEWARFDGDYLIASVAYSLDDRGELVQLSVVPPAAYALQAQKELDPGAVK